MQHGSTYPTETPRPYATLACAKCGGGFTFRGSERGRTGRAEFGLLACSCGEYPVVDGVPILQPRIAMFDHVHATPQSPGTATHEVVALLKCGRADDALLACLCVPWRPRGASLLGARIAQDAARHLGRRATARMLERRDRMSARDVLGFFYRRETLGPEIGHYFECRIGQPRHLALLALAANVEGGPIADVCCGIGHLAHYLTGREPPADVVGLDMNFHQAWIARHWVAPRATFACCNVEDGLPLAAGAVAAIVVSDAYHYLRDRAGLLREAERVAPRRPLILTRVGNAAVMPNEGNEGTLAQYLEELGGREVRAFAEEALVRDYLAGRNPLDREPDAHDAVERAKWLSLACNLPVPDLRPRDQRPAHAVGRPAINPVYVAHGSPGELTFRFPSTWYAYENHQMLEYHPEHARLDPASLQAVEQGVWAPELDEARERFVVVGVPERY